MSLKDLLAELQKTYIASFPEKIALIEKLWKEQRLEELKTEFHKLKGTGRTYGLPEVSDLGRELEALCETSPATLKIAVPHFLSLFARIGESRSAGNPFPLSTDCEFEVILELSSTRRAG